MDLDCHAQQGPQAAIWPHVWLSCVLRRPWLLSLWLFHSQGLSTPSEATASILIQRLQDGKERKHLTCPQNFTQVYQKRFQAAASFTLASNKHPTTLRTQPRRYQHGLRLPKDIGQVATT